MNEPLLVLALGLMVLSAAFLIRAGLEKIASAILAAQEKK